MKMGCRQNQTDQELEQADNADMRQGEEATPQTVLNTSLADVLQYSKQSVVRGVIP